MVSKEQDKENAPKQNRTMALALIAAGIVFPLGLAAWALSTHDAFDNVRDYSLRRRGAAGPSHRIKKREQNTRLCHCFLYGEAYREYDRVEGGRGKRFQE